MLTERKFKPQKDILLNTKIWLGQIRFPNERVLGDLSHNESVLYFVAMIHRDRAWQTPWHQSITL